MFSSTTNGPMTQNLEPDQGDSQKLESHRHTVPLRRGSKYADILLQQVQATLPTQDQSVVVGVISFLKSQGTTTALNLGIRAADHRISPALVIDGNSDNQKVSRLYRTGRTGLSDCLTGGSTLAACLKKTKIDGLGVLGLGQAKVARQQVMATDATVEFFEAVRDTHRLAIVDLPATTEPSLANALIPYLDGVLVVARYGMKRESLERLKQDIENSGGKIIGSVMTGSESKLPTWLGRFF